MSRATGPEGFSPREFGAAFSRFLDWINDEEGTERESQLMGSLLGGGGDDAVARLADDNGGGFLDAGWEADE